MARISKRTVKTTILEKIFNLLSGYVASIHTKKNSKKFLNELLTETEKIMIAKRIAIVVMLERGQSYMVIQEVLKVSPDTVSRLAKEKREGKFAFIEDQCNTHGTNQIGDQEFWTLLEKILLAGMPPRGRGRWKYLYKITEDNYKL